MRQEYGAWFFLAEGSPGARAMACSSNIKERDHGSPAARCGAGYALEDIERQGRVTRRLAGKSAC